MIGTAIMRGVAGQFLSKSSSTFPLHTKSFKDLPPLPSFLKGVRAEASITGLLGVVTEPEKQPSKQDCVELLCV